MPVILEVNNVSKHFGGITAVNNVSFVLNEKEIVGLIGPNGAGKTTIFNVITGTYKPDRGEIVIRGKRVDGLPAYRIARESIRRTYQIVRPFPEMSVRENLVVGALFGEIEGESPDTDKAGQLAEDAMRFTGLDEKAEDACEESQPGGEEKTRGGAGAVRRRGDHLAG